MNNNSVYTGYKREKENRLSQIIILLMLMI